MASWTSRSLNKQNSSFILSYITKCFTHANSCIFCYTKRKRTKNLYTRNCLSKISLSTQPYSLLGGEGGGNLGGFRLCYSKIYLIPPLWSNVSLWSSLIDSQFSILSSLYSVGDDRSPLHSQPENHVPPSQNPPTTPPFPFTGDN